MGELWASNFKEIPSVLKERGDICNLMVGLIIEEPICAEEIRGEEQLNSFRETLVKLAKTEMSLEESINRVEQDLSCSANGKAEALVRLQLSRFYNQAVILLLMDNGASRAYVPRCSDEMATSPCSRELAGKGHSLQHLYDRLVETYSEGRDSDQPVIPGHPYCIHVIKPFHDF